MKRLLLITILLTFLCHSAFASTVFHKDIILTSPDAIWTDSRTYSTLQDALNAIGASNRDLYIAKNESVGAMTINSNIRLHFLKDGAINNSGQLTINTKDITAGHQQIFTGSGDIDFATGSIVRSTWFSSLPTAITITNDDDLTLVISAQSNIDVDCTIGDHVYLRWDASNLVTIDAGKTLSNVKFIQAGEFQLFTGAGDIDFLNRSILNLAWFERLRSIITWIESEKVTLEIYSPSIVSYDNTIPSNIELKFYSGGNFTTDAGKTVTFNTKQFGSSKQPIFLGSGSYTFVDGTCLETDWFADLEDAVTRIGSDDVTLTVTSSDTILNNCTVPSDINLRMPYKEVILTVINTKTLNINKFSWGESGKYEIFNGDGDVRFYVGSVDICYPEWWGAIGDGVVDDYVALQRAVSSNAACVKLSHGKIYISDTVLSCKSNQVINLNQSTIKGGGDNDLFNLSSKHDIVIKNGILDGNISSRSTTVGIYGIIGVASYNCEVSDIRFIGCGAGPGRTVEDGTFITFEANNNAAYPLSSSTGRAYNNRIRDCTFDDEYVSYGVQFKTQHDYAGTSYECYNNHAIRNKFNNVGRAAVNITGHKTHSCSADYNIINASKINGIIIDNGACDSIVSFNTIKSIADGLSGTGQYGGISVCSVHNATNGSLIAEGNKVIGNSILSVRRTGIRLVGSQNTQVSDNNIDEFGLYAIILEREGTNNICPNNNNISNITIKGPAGYFNAGQVSTTPDIILVVYAEGLNLDNVHIVDSPYRAIYVTNCSDVNISNTTIKTASNSTSSYPIYVNASSIFNLTSSIIKQTGASNTTSLIRVLNTGYVRINNNGLYASNVTNYSIYSLGSIFDVMVSGNDFGSYGGTENYYNSSFVGVCINNNPNNEILDNTSSTTSRNRRASKIDSSGGAVTVSLHDGFYIGQVKTIVMTSASNPSTVSVDHHPTSDPEVGTFNAPDETWILEWTGTEWITIFATCTFL